MLIIPFSHIFIDKKTSTSSIMPFLSMSCDLQHSCSDHVHEHAKHLLPISSANQIVKHAHKASTFYHFSLSIAKLGMINIYATA